MRKSATTHSPSDAQAIVSPGSALSAGAAHAQARSPSRRRHPPARRIPTPSETQGRTSRSRHEGTLTGSPGVRATASVTAPPRPSAETKETSLTLSPPARLAHLGIRARRNCRPRKKPAPNSQTRRPQASTAMKHRRDCSGTSRSPSAGCDASSVPGVKFGLDGKNISSDAPLKVGKRKRTRRRRWERGPLSHLT